MLPVRDEADIIGQCLEHLLRWADSIYVFDNGSVDGDLGNCSGLCPQRPPGGAAEKKILFIFQIRESVAGFSIRREKECAREIGSSALTPTKFIMFLLRNSCGPGCAGMRPSCGTNTMISV